LYARLTVALLSGRDASQVLVGQREIYLERMRELQALRRGATGPDLLAVTYELTHLDADLRWIEQSGARLASMSSEKGGEVDA
ncbi:MAG: PadR family transcriptional regulator, partial [Jiangellaceae bacterium]